jgi:multiple sugar transport system substrate-binding protein
MIGRGAIAVAALAAALGAGGCRDHDAGTTIVMWAMGREGELVTALTRDFEGEHPGVRVVVQQVPWQAAHEKLLTAFVGDATPDVAQLGNTWVPELAALGALAPLDAAVAGSSTVAPADHFAGIWQTNQVDGVLFGVPWYVDTRLVFYRRDLLARAGFAAPPTTWPAWLDALRAIKANGAGAYAILLPLDEHDQLLAFAQSQPDDLLRDGGRFGNFRSPGFRRALGFYLQLFAEELAPRVTQTQASNAWNELGRGYVAMMIQGPWSVGEMRRRLPADLQPTWTTAALPGPDGPGTSTAGGASLVVFERSQHRAAAWALIEYLSRPAVQRRFQELTGNLPPRRASWADAAFLADPEILPFRDQLERIRPVPRVPEWERIATAMRFASEAAARRVGPRTTPAELERVVDQTVTALDGEVDAILAKRRWILARQVAATGPEGAP